MLKVKEFEGFNARRYSNPWICKFENGKQNFDKKVGGYTGAYGNGEAGYLYISDPVDNGIYSFGQKDYRGGHTEVKYLVVENGQIREIERKEALEQTIK